ncbi:MAG TPA: hypothetical protein VLE20_14010 [Blastocatellia bacterium]|jgi:hypothetical protein|nr:hypothetical protein [Blastocatellia bacterium]
MFGNSPVTFSIRDIKRIYPNEWVAILVSDTDSDGFALRGEVIVHDADEQCVWASVKLGEAEDPVYVFHTGSGQIVSAVA